MSAEVERLPLGTFLKMLFVLRVTFVCTLKSVLDFFLTVEDDVRFAGFVWRKLLDDILERQIG